MSTFSDGAVAVAWAPSGLKPQACAMPQKRVERGSLTLRFGGHCQREAQWKREKDVPEKLSILDGMYCWLLYNSLRDIRILLAIY